MIPRIQGHGCGAWRRRLTAKADALAGAGARSARGRLLRSGTARQLLPSCQRCLLVCGVRPRSGGAGVGGKALQQSLGSSPPPPPLLRHSRRRLHGRGPRGRRRRGGCNGGGQVRPAVRAAARGLLLLLRCRWRRLLVLGRWWQAAS